MVRSAMHGTKKKGNRIDCPNRHWFAGESYNQRCIQAILKSSIFTGHRILFIVLSVPHAAEMRRARRSDQEKENLRPKAAIWSARPTLLLARKCCDECLGCQIAGWQVRSFGSFFDALPDDPGELNHTNFGRRAYHSVLCGCLSKLI